MTIRSNIEEELYEALEHCVCKEGTVDWVLAHQDYCEEILVALAHMEDPSY